MGNTLLTHTAEPGLAAFDSAARTRLVFGANSVERAGALARELGARKILLVTDAGLVAAGHAPRVVQILQAAGLEVAVFDRVRENPTTRCVEACVAAAQAHGIDTLVGLGGGSSLDTAKGCNFIFTNGGRMQDYWGVGKATRPMLPLVAIPTTAGTGSECQCAALITDPATHRKMACLDPKVAARVAILDPVLTVSQPPQVTACTGLDAIAHAVETAVTTKRNPLSMMYAREAFRLAMNTLPRVLAAPQDLEARGRMLLGAAFAGMAIENSMLGAAHAAANPLTAHHGVAHGRAVAMMLPQVVRFNAQDPGAQQIYAELAALLPRPPGGDAATLALGLADELGALLDLTQMPRALVDCGVKREQLPALAEEAAEQWTAQFNPRPIVAADFLELYQGAFTRRPSVVR